jgi:hypothetical protein
MAMKCILGHSWEGCTCKKCGKTRDERHDWKRDCERCWYCGKKSSDLHQWDGCKCLICGSNRDSGHDWDGLNCRRCGKKIQDLYDPIEPACTDDRFWAHVETALQLKPEENLARAKCESSHLDLVLESIATGNYEVIGFNRPLAHAICLDIQEHGEVSMFNIAHAHHALASRALNLLLGSGAGGTAPRFTFPEEENPSFGRFLLALHWGGPYRVWYGRLLKEWPSTKLRSVVQTDLGMVSFMELAGLVLKAKYLRSGPTKSGSMGIWELDKFPESVRIFEYEVMRKKIEDEQFRKDYDSLHHSPGAVRWTGMKELLAREVHRHLDLAIAEGCEDNLLPAIRHTKEMTDQLRKLNCYPLQLSIGGF